MSTFRSAEAIQKAWANEPRWQGIERRYRAEDVVRLRGTVAIEHTLARMGAERLWNSVTRKPPVRALAKHEPGVVVHYPRLKAPALESIVGFFWRVYQLHRSEAMVLLERELLATLALPWPGGEAQLLAKRAQLELGLRGLVAQPLRGDLRLCDRIAGRAQRGLDVRLLRTR